MCRIREWDGKKCVKIYICNRFGDSDFYINFASVEHKYGSV